MHDIRLRSVYLTTMMILFDFLYNSFTLRLIHVCGIIYKAQMEFKLFPFFNEVKRMKTHTHSHTYIFHTRCVPQSLCVDKNAFWRLFCYTNFIGILTSLFSCASGENGALFVRYNSLCVCASVILFAHAV